MVALTGVAVTAALGLDDHGLGLGLDIVGPIDAGPPHPGLPGVLASAGPAGEPPLHPAIEAALGAPDGHSTRSPGSGEAPRDPAR